MFALRRPHLTARATDTNPSETGHRMLTLILGVVVIAHGLVTAAIWVAPTPKNAPFDASHSWLFGDVRGVSVVLGLLVALAFVATGAGMLGNLAWWPVSAIIAGLAGTALMVLWFNLWLILGLAISVAVLVAGIIGSLANS